MNKKLKNILSVGAITMLTASSMLPVNALCKSSNTKHVISRNVYIYVNGVKYKLPLSPACPNLECKPQFKPDNNCNSHITIKPNHNNSNSNITTKPGNNNNSSDNTATKPNTNNNSSSNTTTKPSTNNNSNDNTTKPNTNNNSSNNTTTTNPSTNNNSSNNTTDFSSYQQQVLDLVNAERTKRGLSPLTLDAKLCNVATKKAEDMATKNYFDHTSPTYGSPFDMMRQFGVSYQAAGENIAKGQTTPQEVMNSWMNSSGHRANILSSNFTKLGVGVAKDSNGRLYWSQMFIG